MLMKLTKEERVLNLIKRKEVDYLPSQITFADRSRYTEISKVLGLTSNDMLDDYLENHFYFSYTLQDKPMYFSDIKEEIEKLRKLNFAFPDWNNNIVYDQWGIGYKVGIGTFFVDFHPLQKNGYKEIINYMPKRLKEVLTEKKLEIAIKKYSAPSVNTKNNFTDWINDLKKYSGNFLVLPIGYNGIFEKSCSILGWEEFMTNIALKPSIIEGILDKVTNYKIEIAKKIIDIGFKIAHSGDDFGTQTGGFFSEKMFKNIIIPRLKKHFLIFKKAGLPIMFHSCGNITQYIPDLIDIGLDILEPCQPCMDLNYLKKEFGKDIIFYGGINTQSLPYLSKEQTKDMVINTIRTLGKGGGYIIAPSQEITNDVPLDNIKVLIDTIKEERENVLYL